MPKPSSPRERQRQQQRAQERARQQAGRKARNRRLIFGVLGAVLVLALVAGYLGAIGSGTQTTSGTSTSTASASTSSTTPPTTIALPLPAAGADLTTSPTPCPADDGSSPRTTTFAGAPPMCIDPTHAYDALMHTSKGDIRFFLNPQTTPNTVNNFVVLARYHYFDGQPLTSILPRTAFAVAGRIENPAGRTSPGYTIPSEAPPSGSIYTPGTIAMIPEQSDKTAVGASFLVATFEQASGLSPTLVVFGNMVDGEETLIAIDKAGTASAEPTEVITIDSIVVTQSVAL